MIENEKKPRDYGIGDMLYPSEVHMIMVIGDNENMHVSELARIAGVTKGAVSQMISKLDKKGLIRKVKDSQNKSKILIALTNKGKIAYYKHAQVHEEMDKELFDYLDGLDDKQFMILSEFIDGFEKMVERHS